MRSGMMAAAAVAMMTAAPTGAAEFFNGTVTTDANGAAVFAFDATDYGARPAGRFRLDLAVDGAVTVSLESDYRETERVCPRTGCVETYPRFETDFAMPDPITGSLELGRDDSIEYRERPARVVLNEYLGSRITFSGPALTEFSFAATIAGVPEPASWAMMIAGFGLLGGALRRHRVSSSVSPDQTQLDRQRSPA